MRMIYRFLSKIPKAVVRQSRSKWGKQYEGGTWIFLIEEGNYPHILRISDFIEKKSKNRSVNILDVGCGNGALLSAFEKRGFTEYTYREIGLSGYVFELF